MPRVRIEFYGLARLRAGRAVLHTEAATVGEALAAADAACPGLRALVEGQLASEYLVSVGGMWFTGNVGEECEDGVQLLIFGADVGG